MPWGEQGKKKKIFLKNQLTTQSLQEMYVLDLDF